MKFAERGYDGTTVRGIAEEAKVDSALVHHFFKSKEGVFAAAMEDALRIGEVMPSLLADGLDGVGERLLRTFFTLWESKDKRETMVAVIRSATSHEEAVRMLRAFVSTEVIGRLAEAIERPNASMRAALVGSQLIGLIMIRYIVRVDPIASADTETLVAAYAPVIQRYLTAELDLPEGE